MAFVTIHGGMAYWHLFVSKKALVTSKV